MSQLKFRKVLNILEQAAKPNSAIKRNNDEYSKLLSLLGNPEKQLKTIHVAGTNGKGSVSLKLAAILKHSSYKVGLFTSPHLFSFRERIQIDL